MKLLILLCIGSYAAGSINFSILLFKVLGKDDPRNAFSGNPGVVNIYRQAGLFMAAVVWLLDVGRAIGVALISVNLLPAEYVPWSGLALILGNRFPCFHGFRGGKGVANYLGFTTIIAPVAAAASGVAWLVALALFRIPFIASFVMVFILAAGTMIAGNLHRIAVAGVLATVALIYYAHKSNIIELIIKRMRD
jgi:glycerol-3-phosphate acyltransferase PlsY